MARMLDIARAQGGHPIQLISIDEQGHCHLQERAVEVLGQIQGRLAVVGVAGLYRTGKSFLLNRLLGLQEGFEVGPTVNACTKGIWMWDKPVQLAPDLHCIFLDTEGLGSAQRTASCDMQIFSLCVLLSSYFVYNSVGAIDEQAISDLNLVLHLAKHIHVCSRQDAPRGSSGELSQYFPTLLWVLRDFFLRLVDDRGNPITEKDYLEGALASVPGQDDKNQVRDELKELFHDRDCVTLVRPVSEESELRHVQRLPFESLRHRFRIQVDALVAKVHDAVRPKTVGSVEVNGRMLASLAAEYCKAINASAIPTIQSAWTSVVQGQLRLCQKDALVAYQTRMSAEQSTKPLPLGEDRLHDLHKVAKAAAFGVVDAARLDEDDERVQEARAELARRVKLLYEKARGDNAAASKRQCEALAAELSTPVLQRLAAGGSYGSVAQLVGDWEQVRQAYDVRAAGPAKGEVLSDWLLRRMTDSIHRLSEDLRSASDDRLGEMQRRLAAAEAHGAGRAGELEAAREQWALEAAELSRQLDVARGFTDGLPQLPAPTVPPSVAAAMVSHIWGRAQLFVCRARRGLPCRLVHQDTGGGVPARLALEDSLESFVIEELITPADSSSPRVHRHLVTDVRNVWLCADSELARCMHRVLRRGVAEPERVLLLDVPSGPVGLVVHSPQAREEILDGLAVLVAVQRVEGAPELTTRCAPSGLRPPGLSLQAAHLSGSTCAALAGNGARALQLSPEGLAETQKALEQAARALGIEELWRHRHGPAPRDTE